MKQWSILLAVWCGLVAAGRAQTNYLREIEIKSDAEVEGQTDYTVRLTPALTHECDRIVFECVYHQEFPWVNARGKKLTKIYEPVRFTYVRPTVRLVNDLDTYVSFHVPTGRALLEKTYGPKTFNPDCPVTVPRIRIVAESGGRPVWTHEVPAGAKTVLFTNTAADVLAPKP